MEGRERKKRGGWLIFGLHCKPLLEIKQSLMSAEIFREPLTFCSSMWGWRLAQGSLLQTPSCQGIFTMGSGMREREREGEEGQQGREGKGGG